MNGDEPSGGNSLQDIQEIGRRFELAGADAIHVSVGFGAPTKDPTLISSVAPMRSPKGCIVPLAENIKLAVSIPVITVNKVLGDIPYAESILQEGKADLIGLGRPLIADPLLPQRAFEERYDDIRPCIYCCQGCIQSVLEKNAPVACSVNPLAGHETERGPLLPAEAAKKVLVIGGGPAGMQAALTAAERGHEVILAEKEPELGGQLLLASKPPGKKDIDPFTHYLIKQVEKSSVHVEPGCVINASWLEEVHPDVAIIAAGSTPLIPAIPNLNTVAVVTGRDILKGAPLAGDRVVIIGGGQVGCEVAEYLSEQGKEVTVIELLADILRGMPHINKIPLELALEDLNVRIMTKATVRSVATDGVTVEYLEKEELLPADHVVIATGAQPAGDEIAMLVKESVSDVHVIGDAVKAQGILEAIRDGYDIGRVI
jgi:NADPH-dependent 2,4-dienoyl-CoA reductase/sulfur reductase-like enzyme